MRSLHPFSLSAPFRCPPKSVIIRVYLACAISLMIIGFHSNHTRIIFDRHTDHFGISCPIHDNADACIHHGVNMKSLAERCGPNVSPVGDCRDRVYGLILTTREFMDEASKHTQTMLVEGVGIGADLDTFVQTRSRWMIDVMGWRGYERLTTFTDDVRLALHKELDRLQHRCNNFFHGAFHPYGFGSNWHNVGLGLAHSLFYNMTLYPHDDYKNFIRITTCTKADVERSFSADPPETNFARWGMSTVNFKSLGADESALARQRAIIRPKYLIKGHIWWRSVLTYYAIRPNFELRELIRQTSSVPTPCVSMHVRHSDKIMEAPLIEFSKYMEQADRYRAKTGVSNVYLMTDDDKVIESTKDYSNFRFHYLDVARSNKGWEADRDAGVSMDQQEKMFLVDLFSAVQCQHSIVTYSSNVGRLLSEIAYAIQNQEPDVVSLDEEWMMNP